MSPEDRTSSPVVIYSLDPRAWTGPDGEAGLSAVTARLDHLQRLGVTHVWVLPFHPSGGRDGGYDVVDHTEVDPDLGTLGDFDRLVAAAAGRGIGVLVDLVAHHTSADHRWFREARRDPGSRRGRYYVWTRDPAAEPPREPMFASEESVWEHDQVARAWYRHAFFSHQPDLDHSNPDVVREVERVMRFWLRRGADGFRLDALPLTVRQFGSRGDDPAHLLRRVRRVLEEERPGGVLLAETNVPAAELPVYFDRGRGITHALNFWLDDHLFLALARRSAEPLVSGVDALAEAPSGCAYANFVRNHDELALEHLTASERAEVLDAFAPDPEHRVLRGARRRLRGLLGDLRRATQAQVLLLSLPGAPVLQYGDELGAVEDLSRPGRRAVRVPVPWGAVEDPAVARQVDQVARAVHLRRELYAADPVARVDAASPTVVRVTLTGPEVSDGEPGGGTVTMLANLASRPVTLRSVLPGVPDERGSSRASAHEVLLGDGSSGLEGGSVRLAADGHLWVRTLLR